MILLLLVYLSQDLVKVFSLWFVSLLMCYVLFFFSCYSSVTETGSYAQENNPHFNCIFMVVFNMFISLYFLKAISEIWNLDQIKGCCLARTTHGWDRVRPVTSRREENVWLSFSGCSFVYSVQMMSVQFLHSHVFHEAFM